jgi:hypothetical protein
MLSKKFLFTTKDKTLYQLISILNGNKLLRKLILNIRNCSKDMRDMNCSLMFTNIYGLNTLYYLHINCLRQNMYYTQVEKSMNVWSTFKLKCFCLQSRPP